MYSSSVLLIATLFSVACSGIMYIWERGRLGSLLSYEYPHSNSSYEVITEPDTVILLANYAAIGLRASKVDTLALAKGTSETQLLNLTMLIAAAVKMF
jgi:hypothetical protein